MKKPKKRRTNEQVITDIMQYSNHGALAQMFVLDALTKWCDVVIDAGWEKCDSPMINGKAWVSVAKEVKAKLDEHYGKA